ALRRSYVAWLSVPCSGSIVSFIFFFQAEDGIRDFHVTGVQTCALPIYTTSPHSRPCSVAGQRSPHDKIGIACLARSRAEKECEQRGEVCVAVVNRRSRKQQRTLLGVQGGERTPSLCARVAHVMRFVHDQQRSRRHCRRYRPATTSERFNRRERNGAEFGPGCRVAPHLFQNSGSHDRCGSENAGDSERGVGFARARWISQHGATSLPQQPHEPACRIPLLPAQDDLPE